MFNVTVSDIAKWIDGTVSGDPNKVITGIASLKEASNGDLSLLSRKRYLPLLEQTQASAILIDATLVYPTDKTIIRVPDASKAFDRIIELLKLDAFPIIPGISKKASIAKKVKLGTGVCIQPFVVIEEGAVVGDHTCIQAGTYVGPNVVIGSNTLIYPNVSLLKKVMIGSNVIIHSGAVIGSDGFGFEPGKDIPRKSPQVGTVIIEDHVEIGANVTIDRARFDKTVIRKGTKIDNLVHIAHNVDVGESCLLLAQSGIAGSATLGKGVIMAGQAGIAGHIKIGDRVTIAAKSGVTKDTPSQRVIAGFPAQDHMKFKRAHASLDRMPLLFKKIIELEKKVNSLQQQIHSASTC
ncbi:MAG: UDP-3-O-(3-hydroxymyristoyl)glucosamine N-acyltransferase [Candidatus Aureabacteria bacterium]|nr:UDP-3-O-(3-hydroxymyristoyl)glucosamine N-acyltransferase [Candidatus Auribacterota bacterium]